MYAFRVSFLSDTVENILAIRNDVYL